MSIDRKYVSAEPRDRFIILHVKYIPYGVHTVCLRVAVILTDAKLNKLSTEFDYHHMYSFFLICTQWIFPEVYILLNYFLNQDSNPDRRLCGLTRCQLRHCILPQWYFTLTRVSVILIATVLPFAPKIFTLPYLFFTLTLTLILILSSTRLVMNGISVKHIACFSSEQYIQCCTVL